MERLKRAYGLGKIKKESLNRKGYSKFIEITKDVGVTIDKQKILDDQRWDGWKGYITNTAFEAHICICFIAYKVYKELERIMKLMKFPMSVDKALEIAKTIPTVTMKMPSSQQTVTKTLFLTDEQRSIQPLFDLKNYFG